MSEGRDSKRAAIGGGRKGIVLWFTGLSGSGKSTLAQGVQRELEAMGLDVKSLDGDVMRTGLNSDLGYGPEDRQENVRRLSEVAALFADSGFVVLTAAISPFREGRQRARRRIGTDRFVEIWANADLAACERRDPKGLYERAREGRVEAMTGISSPYEPPEDCEIEIDSVDSSPEACVARILPWLFDTGSLRRIEGGDEPQGGGRT